MRTPRWPSGRWARRATVAGVAVVALVAVLTAVLFVWPPVNRPRPAGAILVMSGAGPRDQEGLALAREGYAPLLLVSNGLASNGLPARDRDLCGTVYYGAKVVCFIPRPYTTQGEAQFLARTAAQDHIHTVIVVTGRAQAVRARLRVDRCFHGRVLIDPVAPTGWLSGAYLVAYEWGALFKALVLQRGC